MKRSPFGIISLVAGIMLAIPALLIAIIDGIGIYEGSPLVAFAFPIVAILSVPEAPAQMLPFPVMFPIILPIIAIIFGLIALQEGPSAKRMGIWGIALAIASMVVHAVVWAMYA
jgi:hypothetical protein